MNTSVLGLYDRVEAEVDSLPAFDEMLFYAGAPDAEVVVVSEAPTLPSGPDDHTLYHTVTEEMGAQSVEEIAAFLRSYPFCDEGRNDLFREYVDRILAFCDRPKEEIGFTDLCKQPLAAFGDGTTLHDVWNESAYTAKRSSWRSCGRWIPTSWSVIRRTCHGSCRRRPSEQTDTAAMAGPSQRGMQCRRTD